MPVVGASKRLILLELARHSLHGYALAATLDLPLTGIYQHLGDLANEGLVIGTQEGRRIRYSLTPKGRRLVLVLTE